MTQIAEMYPGISKDSIRLVYRTIYDLRDEIVTADTIHEIAASDVVEVAFRYGDGAQSGLETHQIPVSLMNLLQNEEERSMIGLIKVD